MIATILNYWYILVGFLIIIVVAFFTFRFLKKRRQAKNPASTTTTPASATPIEVPPIPQPETPTITPEEQLAPVEATQRKAEVSLEHWMNQVTPIDPTKTAH